MFSKKITLLIAGLCLLAGFGGGFYYQANGNISNLSIPLINREAPAEVSADFSLFWNVWNQLQNRFVDKEKLDTQELLYGAIEGLVNAAGDPYTVFLRPKDSANFAEEINGSFGGIGIEIGLRSNVITVIAPISGTPAAKAGLLAGDKIFKIGDKSTEGMSINAAVDVIRGPKGTPVRLTISQANSRETREVSIIRDTIKVPTVKWSLLDEQTAHLQLFVFNRNADADFAKAVKEITQSPAKQIILDLRNNPGGLLDSAINLAGYFLDNNQIVVVEKFGNGKEHTYYSSGKGELKDYPLFILINQGSASASEILAGALKDNRSVTLVGEQSFGKGSVQEVNDLPGKSSLKITIAKWYTPKGISINENGITPDITVGRTADDINAERDPQLDKARELAKNIR